MNYLISKVNCSKAIYQVNRTVNAELFHTSNCNPEK